MNNLNLLPRVFGGVSVLIRKDFALVQEQDFNLGIKRENGDIWIGLENCKTYSMGQRISILRSDWLPYELDGEVGYIDTKRGYIIPRNLAHAYSFSEGMAVVRDIETQKEGYISHRVILWYHLNMTMHLLFTDGFGKVNMYARDGNLRVLSYV